MKYVLAVLVMKFTVLPKQDILLAERLIDDLELQ